MLTEIERRPLLLLATGLVFGLVIPTHWPAALLLTALLIALRAWPLRGLVAVALLFGLVFSPRSATILCEQEYVSGVATVLTVPRIYPDHQTSTVEIGGRRMLMASERRACFGMGDRLRISGIAKPLSEIAEPIYAPRGVCAKLMPIHWSVESPGPWPMRAADSARRSFLAMTERVLPRTESAWIDALCFNADSLLDDRTEEALRQTGTIHVVSASGLQVLIIGQSLLLIMALLPIPRSVQVVLVVALLALYAMATGLHGPIVRAVVATSLASLAYAFRREPDMISALAASAILYLLWRPYEVYQAGFQLSFVTIGAFALFLPRTDPAKGFGARIWKAFRPSLIASLASGPLVAYHFGYVSVIGLLANSVATFVVPVVVVLAMAGFVSSFVWPAVGAGLMLASAPIVAWMHAAVGWCAGQSLASISVPAFSPYWLVALYGAFLLTWRRRVVQA